jgi:hypothetical protein
MAQCSKFHLTTRPSPLFWKRIITMRLMISTVVVGLALFVSWPASAVGFLPSSGLETPGITSIDAQYTRRGSRAFRRCMRAKYGPRYFHRVPRAVRFHMAQACGS